MIFLFTIEAVFYMYVRRKLTYFFIFFLIILSLLFHNKQSKAAVKIEKIDGVVDWEKASNYVEAKQIMEIAKDINREKKRRKQLRDAGVSEKDIKTILKNEKNINYNNEKISTQNLQKDKKIALSNQNDEYENEQTEILNNEDDDVEDDIEFNNQKIKSSNQQINDYYITKPKIKSNSDKEQKNNIIDKQINLNIIPDIPDFKKNSYSNNNMTISNEYDDFELSRMLTKAGENINNPVNFAIFTKEISKIINQQNNKKQLKIPEIEEYVYGDNGDFSQLNNNYFSYKKKKNKKINKNNINYKNLSNMYAMNNEKKETSSYDYNYNKDQTRRFYAENNNDKEEILYENNESGRNTLTDGQIKAKNMGAPYPYKREKINHNTQYQPQNIAQIAYDQNNKHLQPAVFESHVIKQVFDNLGNDNAIQLARALINKIGEVDIRDEEGNTILMHAVARKNQSLIAMLLAEGANPNTMNNDGFSPLHLATSNGDNIAVYSLMMSGGKPNLRDNNGNTSLMYASKMCNANSVKLMMSLGGDPNIENRSTGKTSFDFASENDDPTVINLLVNENKKMLRGRKPVNLLQS